MAHGKFWTAAEDEVIRRCYASGSPRAALDALEQLPTRKNVGAIHNRASKLGVKIARTVAATVNHDVRPDPLPQHPSGYARPVMCPNCGHVHTVPADPRAT